MLKTLLLVAAGLGAGFAIALVMQPSAPPEPLGAEPPGSAGAAAAFGGADAGRLEELEAALQDEVTERMALEQRVIELDSQLAELRTQPRLVPRANGDRQGAAPVEEDAAREAAAASLPPNARGRMRGPPTPEDQIARLVAAGLSPDRATWIQQRTAELTLETMQAQYTARREGQQVRQVDIEGTLRTELGEQDYERYLEATGRPTRVGVFNVLAGSPGERAGLRAGDEIVRYAGERVFDVRDLNDLTFGGSAGESVVVDVMRDGQNLQLVVPRGPIGIGGGQFRRGP